MEKKKTASKKSPLPYTPFLSFGFFFFFFFTHRYFSLIPNFALLAGKITRWINSKVNVAWLSFSFISGRHGVGRIDIVENRFVGMKSRGKCLFVFCSVIKSKIPVTFYPWTREGGDARNCVLPRLLRVLHLAFNCSLAPAMQAIFLISSFYFIFFKESTNALVARYCEPHTWISRHSQWTG